MTTRMNSVRAIAVLLGVAVPYSAHAAEALPGEAVRYADLDLSQANGAAALDKRIKRAAAKVCRDAEPQQQIFLTLHSACVARAYAGARPQMERAIAQAQVDLRLAAGAGAAAR